MLCGGVYVFRTLVVADIPLNEGSFKPLRIIAPAGTMINPSYPAAVIAGNTEVSQAVANARYGALGVLAGSHGTMNKFVWETKSCRITRRYVAKPARDQVSTQPPPSTRI